MGKSRRHLRAELDPCLTRFCTGRESWGESGRGLCYGMGSRQEQCCTSTQKTKTNPKTSENFKFIQKEKINISSSSVITVSACCVSRGEAPLQPPNAFGDHPPLPSSPDPPSPSPLCPEAWGARDGGVGWAFPPWVTAEPQRCLRSSSGFAPAFLPLLLYQHPFPTSRIPAETPASGKRCGEHRGGRAWMEMGGEGGPVKITTPAHPGQGRSSQNHHPGTSRAGSRTPCSLGPRRQLAPAAGTAQLMQHVSGSGLP